MFKICCLLHITFVYFRDPALIERAVASVKNGDCSTRKAAVTYGVPFETLRLRCLGRTKSSVLGRPPMLSKENEIELSEALNELGKMGHGVCSRDLRSLGREICELQGSSFKNDEPTTGWVHRFCKRNKLSLRTPENCSAARFDSEKQEIVDSFFQEYRKLLDKLLPRGLTASEIYNTDETGLCLVGKSGKIVVSKGSKQVRLRKGGERGENITCIATVNASGSIVLPPMIIFKGKSLNEDLFTNAIEGTFFAHSKSSFVDSELFEKWFDRFIVSVPPKRPLLLLMDGHLSHITLNIIRKATAQDIHILIFPAHLTHLLQPLDVSVFYPLNTEFDYQACKLMRKNKLKALNRSVPTSCFLFLKIIYIQKMFGIALKIITINNHYYKLF